VKVTFLGAAREVTGSCHLVQVGEAQVALDLGLFQGRRHEAHARNRQLQPALRHLDAVVLSHAHIDHSGRLPLLARHGVHCPVYATEATRDLCAVMLADSAQLQLRDAAFLARRGQEFVEPLYDPADVEALMQRMRAVPFGVPVPVAPGISVTLTEAGHILGSASVILDCEEAGTRRRLVYSGDIGRAGLPIIRDPQPPEGADFLIMESTYGDRDHPPAASMPDVLAAVVTAAAARGGRILIPAFAVGRAQEIIYDLHRLARARRIPPIPVVVDSPMTLEVTTVFRRYSALHDRAEPLIATGEDPLTFDLLEFTRSTDDSRALNTRHGPFVVIAASGMAEGGRILHHLIHGASDPRNTILIVGFQAEHTLGRRIVERRPTIRVLGEDISLRAEVRVLDGYSAHADREELVRWARAVRGPKAEAPLPVALVHGEPAAQEALAARLRADGFDPRIPARGEQQAL
jgi:metallo-beta-lactamase family protein